MDSTFKELPLHCSDLSKLMREITEFPDCRPSEWLDVASSVDKVECFTGRFSNCWMCSSADEYDEKRDKLLSSIITELTRFLFIWNALEVLIEEEFVQSEVFSKNSIKKIGKINIACNYLKKRNIDATAMPWDSKTLRYLKCVLEKSANFDVTNNKEWISQAGEGLYVVSRIRNKFAHGSHSFPEPEDWNEKNPLDVKIIQHSSRILLLSMQMLLMAYYKDDDFIIDCWWDNSIPDDRPNGRELEVKAYLREMHLEKDGATT